MFASRRAAGLLLVVLSSLIVACRGQPSIVTTLAGQSTQGSSDGQGTAASFYRPQGLAFDAATDTIYVADNENNAIRAVTAAGVVTTLAGGGYAAIGFADGSGTAANFYYPTDVAVHPLNGNLYVVDRHNCAIRVVTLAGSVTTLAGGPPPTPSCGYVDGTASIARFNQPTGAHFDASGNLFGACSLSLGRVSDSLHPPV